MTLNLENTNNNIAVSPEEGNREIQNMEEGRQESATATARTIQSEGTADAPTVQNESGGTSLREVAAPKTAGAHAPKYVANQSLAELVASGGYSTPETRNSVIRDRFPKWKPQVNPIPQDCPPWIDDHDDDDDDDDESTSSSSDGTSSSSDGTSSSSETDSGVAAKKKPGKFGKSPSAAAKKKPGLFPPVAQSPTREDGDGTTDRSSSTEDDSGWSLLKQVFIGVLILIGLIGVPSGSVFVYQKYFREKSIFEKLIEKYSGSKTFGNLSIQGIFFNNNILYLEDKKMALVVNANYDPNSPGNKFIWLYDDEDHKRCIFWVSDSCDEKAFTKDSSKEQLNFDAEDDEKCDTRGTLLGWKNSCKNDLLDHARFEERWANPITFDSTEEFKKVKEMVEVKKKQ